MTLDQPTAYAGSRRRHGRIDPPARAVTPADRHASHQADIARAQIPVIMLESGREAALAVVRMAHARSGGLRAGLAAGVRLETKPGRLGVGI